MLQAGLDWLNDQRESYMSESSVTYYRGVNSVTITNATKGQSRKEDVSTFGSYINTQNVDFIIAASEIVIDGSQVLPEKHDWIQWADANSVIWKFEVTPASDGDDFFQYEDPSQKYLRVFTLQNGTV